MEHHRKLERMYAAAPINGWFQADLRVDHRRAVVHIPLRPEFQHSAGATHGCLYFKAMDDAAFFAANSIVEGVFVLTADFQLKLLKPVVSGSIRAVGEVTSEDARRIYAKADLFNDQGELIGRGEGSFAKSQIPLGPEVHYA